MKKEYIWNLNDIKKIKKNGYKVFSCFSCGGGSSMGYKLAGYDVIGNCEIDPKINEVYKKNNHPKYNFLMGVQDFYKLNNIPEELYDIDVLDGKPYSEIVEIARDYINKVGGFEKFAEWGLF